MRCTTGAIFCTSEIIFTAGEMICKELDRQNGVYSMLAVVAFQNLIMAQQLFNRSGIN
jgi:hypothetical protein